MTPTRGRGGRSSSANDRGGSSHAHHSIVVEPPPSDSESMALSTCEIELIHSVMSRLDPSAGTSSSFAYLGNFARSDNSQPVVSAFMSHSMLPWIIDYGASDNMTSQSNLFLSCVPYIGPDKVNIADGTFRLFLKKVWCISHIFFPCLLLYMSIILLPIFYSLVVSLVI